MMTNGAVWTVVMIGFLLIITLGGNGSDPLN